MRWRLLLAFVGLTAVVLAVQDIPLANYLRTVEHDRIVAELQRDAFVIAGHSEETLENPTPVRIAALQAGIVAYSTADNTSVVVVNPAAVAVVTSGGDAVTGEDYGNRPEIKTALSGVTTSGIRDSHTLGEALLYVAVPVLNGDRTVGAVRIASPAAAIDSKVSGLIQGIGVVAALTLLAAAVMALLVSVTVTRPLHRLRLATRSFAGGDLSTRASDASGPGELRELGRDFNLMAARIEQLVLAQRSFAADASHQLRTPLTALRLRLDQAADTLESDPAQAETALAAATQETERLQRLINALLSLARGSADGSVRIDVDVAAVARERVVGWEALADEQGVALELQAPPKANARAAEGAVEQIIDNFIDNALTVAPAGSVISVVVSANGDGVAVEVVDQGPGMTAAERARAFDRFWRADTSTAGTGLGLAIVASLANASRAEAFLDEAPSGGVRAVVRFSVEA